MKDRIEFSKNKGNYELYCAFHCFEIIRHTKAHREGLVTNFQSSCKQRKNKIKCLLFKITIEPSFNNAAFLERKLRFSDIKIKEIQRKPKIITRLISNALFFAAQ